MPPIGANAARAAGAAAEPAPVPAPLHDLDQLYRRAFDQGPAPMAIVDLEGRCIDVNRAFCAMLGRAAGEFLGRSLEELTDPQGRGGGARDATGLLPAQADPRSVERGCRHADGRLVRLAVVLSPLHDAEGSPTCQLAQFQELAAEGPQGLAHRDDRRVRSSPGISARDNDVAAVERVYADVEQSYDLAVHALREVAGHAEASADMDAFFKRLSTTVAELVGAERVAFLRLEDDETLRALPGHGFSAVETALLSGIPCRPGGSGLAEQIVYHGRSFRAPSGLEEEFGPAAQWMESHDAHHEMAAAWRAGARPLGVLVALNSVRHQGFSDGDVMVLRVAALAAGLVWQLKQAEEQLATLARVEAAELRAAAQRAAALEKIKADFLNLAAHELRGPLGVARGYVSLMQDGSLGEPPDAIRRALPMVGAKLWQMSGLIDQMLEAARLEEQRLELVVRELDLRDVVAVAIAAMRPLLTPRHRLEVRVPRHAVRVRGDAVRLQTVLTNLLDNAVKYSPEGGRVRCLLHVRNEHARVAITDEGMGIDPESLPLLFTRFGRVITPDNSHIAGTGLGLHVVREIARLHGGDIAARPRRRQGMAFTVTLPLTAEAPGDAALTTHATHTG